jgi:hypothetical protein
MGTTARRVTQKTVDLTPIFLAAGLPEPKKEYPFGGLTGTRKYRFDYAWPEQCICLEREGGTWASGRHIRGVGYRNDCRKYSEAAICSWVVIRATSDMIKSGEAIALLVEAFRRIT